jgi:hypothetical protein
MLKGRDDLLREAPELHLELRRSGPNGEAEHQVLQPRIAGLAVLQAVDDLGGRAADPDTLLQHVLEVDARIEHGKILEHRFPSIGDDSEGQM